MAKPVQLRSRVDADGVLTLRISLTPEHAGADVTVTIERVIAAVAALGDANEWTRFVQRTYGSCAGLGLERHEQG